MEGRTQEEVNREGWGGRRGREGESGRKVRGRGLSEEGWGERDMKGYRDRWREGGRGRWTQGVHAGISEEGWGMGERGRGEGMGEGERNVRP